MARFQASKQATTYSLLRLLKLVNSWTLMEVIVVHPDTSLLVTTSLENAKKALISLLYLQYLQVCQRRKWCYGKGSKPWPVPHIPAIQ